MANLASKVINIALAEVGYLEKKSNASLDNKTANAGSNNYTKYGRDMFGNGLANTMMANNYCIPYKIYGIKSIPTNFTSTNIFTSDMNVA